MSITRYWTNRTRYIAVVLLLAVFFTLSVSVSKRTSPTCDEVAHHVAAGYSFLKTGDFRMNPSAPPLIREIIAFPLLFMDLKLPTDHVSWEEMDPPVFGKLFFYEYNDDPDAIVFWSRIPVIALSAALAFLVFFWAKRIYGPGAGILALFLYTLSPAVLGNSAIAMMDTGSSFFIMLAVFQYWRFLRCKDRVFLNLVLSGACFGLAQATKITGAILYPLFFVLMFTRVPGRPAGRGKELRRQFFFLLAIFLLGILVLWGTYGFELKPLLVNAPDAEEKVQYIKQFVGFIPFLNRPQIIEWCIHAAKEVPIPLSTYLVTLLGMVHQVAAGGQRVFFFGQIYGQGVRPYYLVNFLIKTPLPVVILVLFNIGCSFFKRRSRTDLQTNVFLVLPVLALFAAASFSRLQGSMRYVLPAYPFLFVWLSDTVNIRFGEKALSRLFKCSLALLLLWYGAGTLAAYPHYLAYFNELAGGVEGNAYKVSHDSDWGQDLPSLGEYLKEERIDRVKLLYFGEADPARYGIKYEEFEEADRREPGDEVYAISVRWLETVDWTKDHEPVKKAGGTIFIYDLRKR